MNHNNFQALRLLEPILRAVTEQGYAAATPIQVQAIPHLLEGRDLLGIAQTGTGKTAAFALPILDFLAGDPRPAVPHCPSALVLTPTRELASQIGDSFANYGRYLSLRHAVVFGGVGKAPQVRAMRRGVDVLVATPGRLLDLMNEGYVDLGSIEVFVLDEADRMLDLGFSQALRSITKVLPKERQSILFSATMPKDIAELAHAILRDPVRVEVTPPATTVERVAQKVLFVEKRDKCALLTDVLRDPAIERALVFTRTKHGADRVVKHLRRQGEKADAIHGAKAQSARERALDGLRTGRVRVLVATDIAARGLDVRDITHVINFDLPNVPESYVHRIGRTARAGREGTAISFCGPDERPYLRDIEKAVRRRLDVGQHPAPDKRAPRLVEPTVQGRATGGHTKRPSRARRRPHHGAMAQGMGRTSAPGLRSARRSSKRS